MSPTAPTPFPIASAEANALALADGWVSHLALWSPQAAPEALALAHALSLATSAGHVCLRLPEAGRHDLIQALLDSGLARWSHTDTITPLVIDPQGRLYLARYHDLETRLAHRIVRALRAPALPVPEAVLDPLARWFGTRPDDTRHEQFNAACMALRQRLTLISGGPGTGKTTTLANLLAGLLLQAPELRIALAAPTGKAAARMLEALSLRCAHLPADIQSRLPREATTLHRLLGAWASGGPVQADARRPLPIDALVIDEASMLDLALATPVLEAVPEHAKIILLGDRDQLAAVEAGAVFAELCALAPSFGEHIVTLQKSFRFSPGSGIGQMALSAREGRIDALLAQLDLPDLDWIDPDLSSSSERLQSTIRAGLQPFLDALHHAQHLPIGPQALTDIETALASFRVLCAVRQGPLGTERLNAEISTWVREQSDLAAWPTDPPDWFVGRTILLTRNDPATGLFNGDLGITLRHGSGALRVYFPHLARNAARETPQAKSAARHPGLCTQGLPIERLPAHETAFASTIHKSQGSEFERVLLVLSDERSPVLTRELLYTGLTRARKHVTLVASEPSLRVATQRATERLSGLADLVRLLWTDPDAPAVHP